MVWYVTQFVAEGSLELIEAMRCRPSAEWCLRLERQDTSQIIVAPRPEELEMAAITVAEGLNGSATLAVASCGGELVHVHFLHDAKRFARMLSPSNESKLQKLGSSCAVLGGRPKGACEWLGAPLAGHPSGSLFETRMNGEESIFIGRALAQCHTNERAATVHVIAFDAVRAWFGLTPWQHAMYVDAWKRQLAATRAWQRCGGCDFILLTSRNAGDFPRVRASSAGATPTRPQLMAGFSLADPFWANTSKLSHSVERFRHVSNLISIPYATGIHFRNTTAMREWQLHLRTRHRPWLLTFIGGAKSHREEMIASCRASPQCHALGCADNPAFCRMKQVYASYLLSRYCIIPRGDTYARRALFDALVCGCIPVVQHRLSAAYPWHIDHEAVLLVPPPDASLIGRLHDASSTSQMIAGTLLRRPPPNASHTVPKILAAIRSRTPSMELAQRLHVTSLLPKIIYNTGAIPDAFTVALAHARAVRGLNVK